MNAQTPCIYIRSKREIWLVATMIVWTNKWGDWRRQQLIFEQQNPQWNHQLLQAYKFYSDWTLNGTHEFVTRNQGSTRMNHLRPMWAKTFDETLNVTIRFSSIRTVNGRQRFHCKFLKSESIMEPLMKLCVLLRKKKVPLWRKLKKLELWMEPLRFCCKRKNKKKQNSTKFKILE